MPTRRQIVALGGAGGSLAALGGFWWQTGERASETDGTTSGGADGDDDGTPSERSAPSESATTPDRTVGDGPDETAGSTRHAKKDGTENPLFDISYSIDRPHRVRLDREITVGVRVENEGDAPGTMAYRLTVRHDDIPQFGDATTGDVSLKPGASKSIEHVFGFDRTGYYTLRANKEAIDTFRVYRRRSSDPDSDPSPDPETEPGLDGRLDGDGE